jgi:eukaryotic-like serine/threonine-protein kinase
VSTVDQLGDEAHAESPRTPTPRRATGIPTSILAAQQRIQPDGTVASTQSFELPFRPGEIINGKYRIQELLGVGGVGFVVSATHLQLDDCIALKILKPEFASHPEAVRSFTVEARTSFRIRSEHIVRVHDVDVLPDGIPFMVMELLEGQDLRRILKKYQHLSIELAVDVALQTCEALAAAHACQIVHRDIKPENLFLIPSAETAHIKVLDFGISQALASATGAARAPLTPGMVAVGTPPYMSPEQIRGSKDLDARADLWSLGCVLYELLTGVAPFARMSVMQACAAVLEDEPVPVREARPDVPPELEDVVMRCLRKQPSKRFLNAAELANALAPFGRHAMYCATRCAALLSKDSRSSDPSSGRSEPPPPPSADATGPRAQSRLSVLPGEKRLAGARLSSTHGRRQTMNPLSTPVNFAARKPSSLGLVPTASAIIREPDLPLAPANMFSTVTVQQEDTDMNFVPGLRPRRGRWLVLATSAIAIGATYLAFLELKRTEPGRMSLHKSVAAELKSLANGYTNAQSEGAESHGDVVAPSSDLQHP